jgi:hypothetical protein
VSSADLEQGGNGHRGHKCFFQFHGFRVGVKLGCLLAMKRSQHIIKTNQKP